VLDHIIATVPTSKEIEVLTTMMTGRLRPSRLRRTLFFGALLSALSAVLVTSFHLPTSSLSSSSVPNNRIQTDCLTQRTKEEPAYSSRRDLFSQCIQGVTVATGATLLLDPSPALAKADCYSDCLKNCKTIAPKDLDYCKESCIEYCEQPDREDGLSGSVSSAKGETGILGGTFGQGTVPKGEDKPPSLVKLPGLDFSSDAGRKLIGY